MTTIAATSDPASQSLASISDGAITARAIRIDSNVAPGGRRTRRKGRRFSSLSPFLRALVLGRYAFPLDRDLGLVDFRQDQPGVEPGYRDDQHRADGDPQRFGPLDEDQGDNHGGYGGKREDRLSPELGLLAHPLHRRAFALWLQHLVLSTWQPVLVAHEGIGERHPDRQSDGHDEGEGRDPTLPHGPAVNQADRDEALEHQQAEQATAYARRGPAAAVDQVHGQHGQGAEKAEDEEDRRADRDQFSLRNGVDSLIGRDFRREEPSPDDHTAGEGDEADQAARRDQDRDEPAADGLQQVSLG